ncbi:MAG TPA: hypothetical protein VFE46_17235 [Pirellulales bacterium]|jgi:hypothetical protein|nr:hypothetical protein [Pirellulales bacterium]
MTPEEVLGQCVEKMETAYSLAKDRGTDDPIVLVLDVRDSDARRTATILAGDDAVAQALSHSDSQNTLPTLVTGIPRQNAIEICGQIDEAIANWLKKSVSPEGEFIAVCISDGKCKCRSFRAP